MKVTITLTDTPSGHVKIDTNPPTPKMVEIAKDKRTTITPALAYAMNALSVIMKASVEQSRQEQRVAIPDGILRPKFVSPRR